MWERYVDHRRWHLNEFKICWCRFGQQSHWRLVIKRASVTKIVKVGRESPGRVSESALWFDLFVNSKWRSDSKPDELSISDFESIWKWQCLASIEWRNTRNGVCGVRLYCALSDGRRQAMISKMRPMNPNQNHMVIELIRFYSLSRVAPARNGVDAFSRLIQSQYQPPSVCNSLQQQRCRFIESIDQNVTEFNRRCNSER